MLPNSTSAPFVLSRCPSCLIKKGKGTKTDHSLNFSTFCFLTYSLTHLQPSGCRNAAPLQGPLWSS